MNKLFVFIIASMLMIGTVGAVPSTPMPVAIKVIMNNPSDAIGVDVIVRDMTHPFTMILKTNEYAEAICDWGNAGVRGETGDSFEVEINGKIFSTTMQDSGLGGGIVFANLVDSNYPIIEDKTPFSLDTCPIKEVVKEVIKEVPVEIIKTVEVIKEVPAECPIDNSSIGIIISIITSLVVGTGIGLSIYRDGKTGNIKFSIKSHKHYGREFLHSIYSVHRTNAHGYGEPVPVYVNGKYVINSKYPMK